MAFNVVGPDDANDVLARDVEEQCSKDPSYPWRFEVRENDGPVLCGDAADLTERHHRELIELTKRHPRVAFVTGEVEVDDDTGKMVGANLVRYARGRRRIVATVRNGSPERTKQMARMIRASLRYA